MVNVWAADITPLLIEEIYRAYYNRVPKWRKEKADKLRNVFPLISVMRVALS